MSVDWEKALRKYRTFAISSCWEIEALPVLPDRVTIDEYKHSGMVNLLHSDRSKKTHAWIPAGWYRTYDPAGKLYLLEVTSVLRGQKVHPWLYQPIIRIKTDNSPKGDHGEAS